MSSYEIKYEGSEDLKDKTALSDTKSYMGSQENWDRLLIVLTNAITCGCSMLQVKMVCSFTGIQGYPVYALTRYICKITNLSMPKEDGDGS